MCVYVHACVVCVYICVKAKVIRTDYFGQGYSMAIFISPCESA